MSRRDRISTVLRVRRVQQLQAAGELAVATAAAREADRCLGMLQRHYDQHRSVDHRDDPVPERSRDHQQRVLQASAIQRGRARVKEAVGTMEERRRLLQVRSQAVRAMERLDERIATEDEIDRRRAEVRELDERALLTSGRSTR